MIKQGLFSKAFLCQGSALRAVTLLGAGLCVAAIAGPVSAQTSAPVDEEAEAPREVIVTGSRIASPTLTSASPLQVTSLEAIRSTGAANLQDVLLQNPVYGSPSVSRTNSNFSTSGAGLATIDLRNLGTSRTLVLVNGRRFVSGSPNGQAVDLNSIPTAFIDHIDTLTGGASSIYGSDAVAGVVNIVYRKDFSGLEANVQTDISQEGDNASKQVNLTMGSNFADGRGNVMAYIGYSKQGAVYSRARARSAIDQTSTAALTGVITDIFDITQPYMSSFAPQGRYFYSAATPSLSGTFDANGNFINGFSTNGSTTRAANGYNRSALRTIAVPVERFLFASRANYEVSPAINVFLESTFAKSRTVARIEPFPLASAGTNGVFQGTGGYFNVEQRLADGTIFVNPFVPAALLARLGDSTKDGLRDVSFTRRMSDIDNRGSVADRTTYRFVVGAEGEISSKTHYDLFLNYGRTDDNQTSTGQVNLANFRYALEVIPDANGKLVCKDVNARMQGCVPANIFGANTLSSAAAYIRADANRRAYADQIQAGANISTELPDLWGAGGIGLAAGVEYRRESSATMNDSLTQAGLNGGNAIPNTSGAFEVKEGYGEVRVPLLTDKPFFRDLALRAAGRVSNYTTIGTVYSYNYGAEYSPVRDIRFRAVRALAVRAPNVGELFTGLSQTFPSGLIDPCIGITATSSGTLADTCRAATGVNTNIAANGKFTQTQADLQGVSGFDSGNPNLKEERANTLTAGVVINPVSIHALRKFTFTADYSRTRIAGAIVGTPRQFILQQCYQSNNPTYCGFVTRRATAEGANSPGSLQFVNSASTNSGGVFNSNIDATLGFRSNLGLFGAESSVDLSVAYTHVLDFYTIPLPGADKDNAAGEIGSPKDRFLVRAGLTVGAVTFRYNGVWLGRSYFDDQFVLQLTEADGTPITNARDRRASVPAYYLQGLQMSAEAGEHFNFYLGVNNLFNVQPPAITSNLPGDVTGTETDAGTYDAIGRQFYAGVRMRF